MNDTLQTDLHEYYFENHDSCAGQSLCRMIDNKDVTWDPAFEGPSVPSALCRRIELERNALLSDVQAIDDWLSSPECRSLLPSMSGLESLLEDLIATANRITNA